MGKCLLQHRSLLQRIEALRLFLAKDSLLGSEETTFKLASLQARLSSRPTPRHPRQWTTLHSDLLGVIREVFGENAQLVSTFFPELPEDYLLQKLRALPLQPSLTADESPIVRTSKGCVERLGSTPLTPGHKEATHRDYVTATPDICGSKPRHKLHWRSLRIDKPCAPRPDFSALSITGASEHSPAEPVKPFWSKEGELPRLSFTNGLVAFEAPARCIIQRL